MAFTPKFADLVRNVASVSGSGPVTIGPALSGFASLASTLSSGDQFYYCIQGVDKPHEREVGRGTMQPDGKVARQAISGSLTSFTGGSKTIALVAPAEWFDKLEGAVLSAGTRAELAATVAGRAYLAEPGRAGNFVFDQSDLSAMVASDPAQGIYVAPSGDPTGASGAWVRRINGPVNVRWFGAKGDGVTDDGAAFLSALALLKVLAVNPVEGFFKGSTGLYIPAGHYFLGTTTLDLTHTLNIEGDGNGSPGSGQATKLRWAAGATGIRVQRYNTAGASGTVAGGFNAGDGGIIRGLQLVGGYAGVEGEFHGIHLRARATIEQCDIRGFQGDGIHVNATSDGGGGPVGNANLPRIIHTTSTGNRKGLYAEGSDVNAGTVIGCDFSLNRQWGVDDSSFLGNSYIGCHSAANGWEGAAGSIPTACTHAGGRYYVKAGQAAWCSTNPPSGTTADNEGWGYIDGGGTTAGVVPWSSGTSFREGGAYKTDNPNAANVFIGCYSEGDQNPSQFVAPTISIGGLHGAWVRGTGIHLTNNQGVLTSDRIGAINRATGFGYRMDKDTGIVADHPSGGMFGFKWFNGDLINCAFNSEVDSNWPFRITGESTSAAIGARRLDFPNGFGLANKKVLSGSAAPTSGAYVQGDMMLNSVPTAGGPMGWMCVAGGSPGTWKAMGNLVA